MKPLAEQMYVYASYHRDARNKRFHFVGVPMITFAILVPMAALRWPVGVLHLSLATLFVLSVLVYYFVLDRALGFAMLLFIAPVLAVAEWVAGMRVAVWGSVFGAFFVVGWIIQLVGHAYEGRKPALVDNLFQVIVSPVFLMAEVFFALGKKRALHDEVERLLGERGLYGVEKQRPVPPGTNDTTSRQDF